MAASLTGNREVDDVVRRTAGQTAAPKTPAPAPKEFDPGYDTAKVDAAMKDANALWSAGFKAPSRTGGWRAGKTDPGFNYFDNPSSAVSEETTSVQGFMGRDRVPVTNKIPTGKFTVATPAGTKTFNSREEANAAANEAWNIPGGQAGVMQHALVKGGMPPETAAKVVPQGATFDMYNTITSYPGANKDPLRALGMSHLENKEGIRDTAAYALSNPHATPEMINKFGQDYAKSHQGGGMLRQIMGNDFMNALPAIAAIAGNVFLPGLGTGVGAGLGAAAGSMMNGANIGDAAKAGLLTWGGANLGSFAKDIAGSAVKSATSGMDLSGGTTKLLTNAAGNVLGDVGKSVLTGNKVDIGKSLLNAGANVAGDLAGAEAKDLTGGSKLAGQVADTAVTTGIRGGDVGKAVTGTLTGAATGAATDFVGDTIKDMLPDTGINIGGFKIDGLPDLKGNIIPGVDAKTATALLNTGALGKDGKKLVTGVNAVKGIASGKNVTGGINTLTNLTKTPPTRRAPPVKIAAKAPPVGTKQPPAAVLAALNKPKPVG